MSHKYKFTRLTITYCKVYNIDRSNLAMVLLEKIMMKSPAYRENDGEKGNEPTPPYPQK